MHGRARTRVPRAVRARSTTRRVCPTSVHHCFVVSMMEQQQWADEPVPDIYSIIRLCNICTKRADRTVMLTERMFSKKGKKIGRCQKCATAGVQLNIVRGQRKKAIAKRERCAASAAQAEVEAEAVRHVMRQRLVAAVPVAESGQHLCPLTLP